MTTDRSARVVFRRAHALGLRLWPQPHASRFSRRDFPRAQLFACLVLREWLGVSFRDAEVFLSDVREWRADIGMAGVPDHNTLWRALGSLLTGRRFARALDLMAADEAWALDAELAAKPLAIDSTHYEPRHRSRHYDRACRKMAAGDEELPRPGKYGGSVNAARSRKLRAMPKLALAVSAGGHRVLAASARLGAGGDAPDFVPLLLDAWRRARVRCVVADAGYDSEDNHRSARLDMGVRSVIPPRIGRPTSKPPTGYYRQLMSKRFKRKADAKAYGQRAQSESTNSMMKRNLGESLRSIRPDRQKQELMLRVLTHNLMLGEEKNKGRD